MSTPIPRVEFCSYLKAARDERAMSLAEISHETRIPEHSLRSLEEGAFEDLPGDVFVRGFVRAYAGCVGLDGEDAVARYAACGIEPAPVSSREADAVKEALREVEPPEPVVEEVFVEEAPPAPAFSARDFVGPNSRVGAAALLIMAVVATLGMASLLDGPPPAKETRVEHLGG